MPDLHSAHDLETGSFLYHMALGPIVLDLAIMLEAFTQGPVHSMRATWRGTTKGPNEIDVELNSRQEVRSRQSNRRTREPNESMYGMLERCH